jgi:hypothetical protein
MTIRDIDCKDFDVEAFVEGLKELEITFFSFFVGGYITTYPTQLEYQRVSPYLGDVDLTSKLVQTAHKHGIKVLAMIDLGLLPRHAGDKNSEWCSKDINGEPILVEERVYQTCPSSKYRLEYSLEIVKEIIRNYDVDCIKFGGYSYGFSQNICYCDSCKKEFKEVSGKDIPLKIDWSNPDFIQFYNWKAQKVSATVKYLVEMVKAVKPGMPVMGNSACFGDAEGTVNSAMDMEVLAKYQDAVQVEVQYRVKADDESQDWQSMTWPAESANFMTHASDKPVWAVASYFLAWPWRRSAMPYAEQKAYYAQIMANGAIPMVNLSGGPMAVHEDKRGFRAIKEMNHFFKENIDYYQEDVSVANVAIIYSQKTMTLYGKDKPASRYVHEIRGFEQALDEAHIPYDIITLRSLSSGVVGKYDTIILPNTACMAQKEADAIREYVKNGGSVICTFETSLYDENGEKRDDYLLGDILGLEYGETKKVDEMDNKLLSHAYMMIEDDSPASFIKDIGDTKVIPADGYFCKAKSNAGKKSAILTLSAPAQVFPEGFAYPLEEASRAPMLNINTFGEGKVVYFAGSIGKNYWQIHYPDIKKLIVNSIDYCASKPAPLLVDGPTTFLTNVREQPQRTMVHLINLTGGKRVFEEIIPLREIEIGLLKSQKGLKSVLRLSDKKIMDYNEDGEYYHVKVDILTDYDVLVFEWIG